MRTDIPAQPKYTNQSVKRVIPWASSPWTLGGRRHIRITALDAIRDCLVDAGWSVVGGSYSVVSFNIIVAPSVALPLPGPGYVKTVVNFNPPLNWPWGYATLGPTFCFYDPYRQTPGTGDCVWVPMGMTMDESVGTLAGYMSGTYSLTGSTGRYVASSQWWLPPDQGGVVWQTSNRGISGFAAVYGTAAAAPYIGAAGGNIWYTLDGVGGGWRLRSQSYHGNYAEVLVFSNMQGDPQITAYMNGGEAFQTMAWQSQNTSYAPRNLTMIASPHQFVLTHDLSTGDVPFSETTLCLSLPHMELESGVYPAYNGFFSGGLNGLGGWGTLFRADHVAINGALQKADGRGRPKLYAHRNEFMKPLVDMGGNVWIDTAHVMYGRPATQPRLMGQLWDSIVVHDYLRPTEMFEYAGKRWTCIASQRGEYSRNRASVCVTHNEEL